MISVKLPTTQLLDRFGMKPFQRYMEHKQHLKSCLGHHSPMVQSLRKDRRRSPRDHRRNLRNQNRRSQSRIPYSSRPCELAAGQDRSNFRSPARSCVQPRFGLACPKIGKRHSSSSLRESPHAEPTLDPSRSDQQTTLDFVRFDFAAKNLHNSKSISRRRGQERVRRGDVNQMVFSWYQ